VERITDSDLKESMIRIHLDGVAFYRLAYERNPTLDNKDKLFQVMVDAVQQIEGLVNGKAKS